MIDRASQLAAKIDEWAEMTGGKQRTENLNRVRGNIRKLQAEQRRKEELERISLEKRIRTGGKKWSKLRAGVVVGGILRTNAKDMHMSRLSRDEEEGAGALYASTSAGAQGQGHEVDKSDLMAKSRGWGSKIFRKFGRVSSDESGKDDTLRNFSGRGLITAKEGLILAKVQAGERAETTMEGQAVLDFMLLVTSVGSEAVSKALPNEGGVWWRDKDWPMPDGRYAADPKNWFPDAKNPKPLVALTKTRPVVVSRMKRTPSSESGPAEPVLDEADINDLAVSGVTVDGHIDMLLNKRDSTTSDYSMPSVTSVFIGSGQHTPLGSLPRDAKNSQNEISPYEEFPTNQTTSGNDMLLEEYVFQRLASAASSDGPPINDERVKRISGTLAAMEPNEDLIKRCRSESPRNDLQLQGSPGRERRPSSAEVRST